MVLHLRLSIQGQCREKQQSNYCLHVYSSPVCSGKHDVHRPTRVCLYTAQKTMRPHYTLRGTNAFDFTVETALRNFTLISFCLDGNKRGIKPFVISNIISTSNSFFCSPLLCHQPFWGTDCFIYFSLAHSRFLKIKTFLLARLWWSNYFKAGVCK